MAERRAPRPWRDWGEALTLGVALAYAALVLLWPTRDALNDLAGLLLLLLLVFGVLAIGDRWMGEPMQPRYLFLALLAVPLFTVGVQLENFRLAGVGAVILVAMAALYFGSWRRQARARRADGEEGPEPPA